MDEKKIAAYRERIAAKEKELDEDKEISFAEGKKIKADLDFWKELLDGLVGSDKKPVDPTSKPVKSKSWL